MRLDARNGDTHWNVFHVPTARQLRYVVWVDSELSLWGECICPLQFDIVDRLITRYSNRGDLVYDPFHGLGTVGVRAIKLGRRAGGSELCAAYFRDQVHYLQAAEREASMPSLFDFEELEAA